MYPYRMTSSHLRAVDCIAFIRVILLVLVSGREGNPSLAPKGTSDVQGYTAFTACIMRQTLIEYPLPGRHRDQLQAVQFKVSHKVLVAW